MHSSVSWLELLCDPVVQSQALEEHDTLSNTPFQIYIEQVCVPLPTLVVSVTLLAFAAVRRAAAPLLLVARRPPLSVDISCAHGAQQQTRRHTPRL